MGKPVLHFEINGRNGVKLQKFYAKLFGWKIKNMPEMNYGMVKTGGRGGINGGIGQIKGHGVIVYVGVDNVKKYLDAAKKAGGKVVMPPTDIPGGPTIAVFRDPEGNETGLVHGM